MEDWSESNMEDWRVQNMLLDIPGDGETPNFEYIWQLENLTELNRKNSNEILISLTENLDDFSKLLTSHLESDWIVVVVSILSKVCSSRFRETRLRVLKVAMNEIFLETLEEYVRILKYEEWDDRDMNKYFWNNPEEFLVNLVLLCDSFVNLNPTEFCDILQKLLKVIEFMPCPGEGTNVAEWQEAKSGISNLMEKLDFCKEHPQQESGTLSVYPTSEEILTSNYGLGSKDFVKGKYDTVKDYLEVQVKLLKESFAATLRENIAQCSKYIQDPNSLMVEGSTIRMYSDVVFGSMVFSWEKLGVIVNFSNKENFQEIFSPLSRSLKQGSVVCFTKDNFRTIFLGSVVNKDCGQHRLIVNFDPEYNSYELNVSYTMLECSVNLYQYCNILQALTSIPEVDFSLKSYLIDAVAEVETPGYLDSNSSIHLGQGGRVDVFGNNWPSADQLQLDSTQYSAFKAALTQKFVMIQGAPGTGKTHLGLQILKTLLHEDNQKLWYNKTPILIVCLSNQVLDQYLEGLLSTTTRIIRVGQEPKSEKLLNFTLRSARTRSSSDGNDLTWKKVKVLVKKLEKYQDCLNKIKNFNYILHFSNFQYIDEKIKTSWFDCTSNSDMIAWLFDEQSRNLHSLKISEILNGIEEEYDRLSCGEDDAAFAEQAILWSKSHTWKQIVRIRNEMKKMETGPAHSIVKWHLMETYLKYLWQTYQYFKIKMNDRGSAESASKPVHVDYESPQRMNPDDRWNLYFYWLNLYTQFVEKTFLELQDEHRQLSKKVMEIRNILDAEIMKDALVLGMTFYGAARLESTLKSLKCPIVVVEEAGIVSESYIMASLTKHCQSLILLDQHRELCPTVGNSSYSLGINVMERMMRNGLQCHVLGVQHRTRPEITELLHPLIYPEVENDHSVTKYPPVLGIPSCKFF